MTTNLEQQIRERAYHLWMADGCLHERADEHWFAAERELLVPSATPAKPKKQVIAKKTEASELSKPPRAVSKRKAVVATEVAAQV